MVGATTPTKTSFKAATVGDAVTAMLESVNQTSTMNIEEFEILQMLEGGQVAIVATKNKKETRVVQGKHISASETAKEVAKAVCPAVVTSAEEKAYTPYSKVEA
jgi:hypothetical protein